jgi:50S ribosomal protein L16 3-hydroxylase
MLYDRRYIYVNGESYRAGGRDGKIMRELANTRRMSRQDFQALSAQARRWMREWAKAGWLVLDSAST